MEPLTTTKLELPLVRRGKVRDTYALDGELLMVATDRLSAFDVVFNEGIPKKGEILNRLSAFWFGRTKKIIPNHFKSLTLPKGLPAYLKGRSMVVERCGPIPLECVVRGHITGSAWKEYQKSRTVCGIKLPDGLRDGSELPEPVFTPSTKAEKGHDENITEEQARKIVGDKVYDTVRQKSVELYDFAEAFAREHGLVLADTKFEFGINSKGKVILIDEALTPDSSRYWLEDKYEVGILESLDKQYVRNYLETTGWNKSPPPPPLPKEVVEKTTERYVMAYKMLTGKGV
ncbi:MAG TPA: phosphoribosylaminoimidazolesuccinocarboxamide synthase [Candidatus Bilamarchaeum sp.]|nr:phosphoribosylaminoimidazolesuccinocarboxamide synthase [Candidatus Bilamarchaeum sp.]